MFKLVPNAKATLLTSMSVWSLYLLSFCILTPNVLYLVGFETNPYFWGWMSIFLALAGIVARVIDEGIETNTKTGRRWKRFAVLALCLAGAMFLSGCDEETKTAADDPPEVVETVEVDRFETLSFTLISKWEGLRLKAYKDIVGVWTVCYGETKGVKPGDAYTAPECADMLKVEIADYRERLRPAFSAETIAKRLPATRETAYVSLAYNVGVHGASRSTAVKKLNRGNVKGGCNALSWWNKAGGRVINGLVRRRSEEVAYCLRGV